MVFFSNDQNDPSSSSGNRTGSGSDSEENRFYKKNINSRCQQSFSSSASEAESDSEQVTSRPAADNPVVSPSPKKDPETPPALKKKPSASDSSAVRNQGTPSEPSPKSPSASKPKRVLAAKRVKVDVSDEEQPERKNKSAFKGKTLAEEGTTPSNSMRKKPRKQQQESAAGVAQSTPSLKDSLRPTSLVGDALEEVDCIEAVGDGRSLAVKEHITAGDYHEEDEEEEEEVEGEADAEIAKVPESLKTPKALVTNEIPDDVLVKLMPGYETFTKKTREVMAELIGDVKKITENSEAEIRALLDSCLGSTNGTRGAGRRANPAAWLRNREPDLEGVYSIREIPGVDEARVQAMEEKWRNLQIRELELRSRRFALLQEECSMQIEALKETSECENSVVTSFSS